MAATGAAHNTTTKAVEYALRHAQIRHDCVGGAYYQGKLEEGKTPKEAIRAVKVRIGDAVDKRQRNGSHA